MYLTLSLLALASVFYVIGGIAMKNSDGFQHFWPSVWVILLFSAGASIQNWAMKKTDLGGAYVFVLGLEGVLAVLAGVWFFDEPLTGSKIFGGLLVLGGIYFLKF